MGVTELSNLLWQQIDKLNASPPPGVGLVGGAVADTSFLSHLIRVRALPVRHSSRTISENQLGMLNVALNRGDRKSIQVGGGGLIVPMTNVASLEEVLKTMYI